MTIEQLIYFKTIVEKKTYSEASIYLNLSQSSLSKQIIKLEKEIELELFDRSKRQIVLTEAGEQFYQDIQKLLNDYDVMMQNINKRKTSIANEIRIAMLPIQAQYDIGDKLRKFKKQNPNVSIIIKEIEERDFDIHLINDDYDIFILRDDWKELKGYKAIPIFNDQIVAVVSCNHPLANKSVIDLSELKDENLLMLPEYTKIRQLCEDACEKAGFLANVNRYARHDTILNAAKDNEGIALVMETSLKLYQLKNCKVLHFKTPIESVIYLYISVNAKHKSSVNDLIQSFMEKE